MKSYKRLWIAFILVVGISFAVLVLVVKGRV
jgi:hypothetical protein